MIYCSIVRYILEYCCEIWHSGLTGQQSRDIERVQKRCRRIIDPQHSYSEALSLGVLERLDFRREKRAFELFDCIKKLRDILNSLLTPRHITPNI